MKIIKSLGFASIISAFALISLTANATNNSCTDYSAIDNAPSFSYPSKSGFRYFWNRWLAKDKPFHMGHDQIIKEGQSTTMVGKFDYGAVLHKDLESEYVNAYLYGTGMDGKIWVVIKQIEMEKYLFLFQSSRKVNIR